ncbi:hypothetical protein Q7P37_005087 [Cladosporium fusiforme]
MAPQWSPTEDRALLLALVQVMAPGGPSKHQFEAAVKLVNDRWTVGAVSQHYNKKLRILTPLETLDESNNPSTPARSATKRKTPAPKTTSPSVARSKKKTPVKASEDSGDESGDEPVAKKAKAAETDGEADED